MQGDDNRCSGNTKAGATDVKRGKDMRTYRERTYAKLYRLQKEIRRSIREAEVATYASGAAFFLFLSIIPAIMMVSGLIPHHVMTNIVTAKGSIVNISQAVIPERVYSFLTSIVDSYDGDNMTFLSLSALVAVWSASKGVLALIRGLNHIYEVDESRNYILLRFRAAFYTVFILIAILLSIGLLVFGNTIGSWINVDWRTTSVIWRLVRGLRHILVAAMISVMFCTMYSVLPNNRITWREHYPGAVFTSVFWTLYSFGFSVYVDYFGGFSMYGSLTTIIIVMIWLYFCMYIFFCGALVNKWIMDGDLEEYF